jgi:hypothetical protein
MKDSVLMFRGQRLSARETHLARAAYLMALDDAASGQLIASPEKRFPLPKVTRPRERTDSRGVTWRVLVHQFRDPVIEYRDESRSGLIHPWREALSAGPGQPGLTVEVARIVTELAANPTEEVDAE